MQASQEALDDAKRCRKKWSSIADALERRNQVESLVLAVWQAWATVLHSLQSPQLCRTRREALLLDIITSQGGLCQLLCDVLMVWRMLTKQVRMVHDLDMALQAQEAKSRSHFINVTSVLARRCHWQSLGHEALAVWRHAAQKSRDIAVAAAEHRAEVASSLLLIAKRRSRLEKVLAAWYRVASQSAQVAQQAMVQTRIVESTLLGQALFAWMHAETSGRLLRHVHAAVEEVETLRGLHVGAAKQWSFRVTAAVIGGQATLLMAQTFSAWLLILVNVRWSCRTRQVAQLAQREHVLTDVATAQATAAVADHLAAVLSCVAFRAWASRVIQRSHAMSHAITRINADRLHLLAHLVAAWRDGAKSEAWSRKQKEMAGLLARAGAQLAQASAKEVHRGRAENNARRTLRSVALRLSQLQWEVSASHAFHAWSQIVFLRHCQSESAGMIPSVRGG